MIAHPDFVFCLKESVEARLTARAIPVRDLADRRALMSAPQTIWYREQVSSIEDLVARHAVGLWELAVLHLSPDDDRPLRLDQAAMAIDAMGGIVDSLGDRLGAHASALRDALGQLRLAFVEVQQRATSGE